MYQVFLIGSDSTYEYDSLSDFDENSFIRSNVDLIFYKDALDRWIDVTEIIKNHFRRLAAFEQSKKDP